MDESFRDFVLRILTPAIPRAIAERLVLPEPLELYFRRAFTHRTFVSQEAAIQGRFNYEVIEKIGDRVLAASFQLYLFEILGNDVHVPQVYADMEKKLTDAEELALLTDALGFNRWIRIAADVQMTIKIQSDVFEAFITAIVLAADRYIPEALDIGFALAKRWIYQVYNTHVRHKIDPRNATTFVDYRTRVNEVWLFNGWGTGDYRTTGDARNARQAGIVGEAGANLIGPNKKSFPENLRGRVIGTGYGKDLDAAREAAAKAALELLQVNFADFKDSETEFTELETARLARLLGGDQNLLARVLEVLRTRKDTFSSISIRKTRIYSRFYVQLRTRNPEGIWEGGERAYSATSYDEAIKRVFEVFTSKALK